MPPSGVNSANHLPGKGLHLPDTWEGRGRPNRGNQLDSILYKSGAGGGGWGVVGGSGRAARGTDPHTLQWAKSTKLFSK